MKRKELIDLPVYIDSGETYVGVVKEILLSKEEFRIEFLLITDKKNEYSFMMPFCDTDFDKKSVFILDKANIVRMGNFYFNDESRYHEVLFCGKDVLTSKGENIGTVIDFSFEPETGMLDEVYYFDYESEKTKAIDVNLIFENKIGYITFGKKDKKANREFYETTDRIDEKKFNMEEDKTMQNYDENFERELVDIISRFKIKIERDHDKLKSSYVIIEKEIVRELDDFTAHLRKKVRNFFDYELKQQEEDFRLRISKSFDDAIEELVDFSRYNNLYSEEKQFKNPEPKQKKYQAQEYDDFYQEEVPEEHRTINLERGKKQIKNPTQTEPVYKSRPQRSYDDENNFDDDLFERLKPKPRVTKDDIILKEKAEMLVSESDDFFEETINPEPPEKSKNHQFGFRRIEPKKTPSQRAEARTNAPKFETKNEPRQKPQPQEQNSKFSKDASSRSHYGVLRRSKLENSPKVNNEQEEKPAFRESRRELEAAQKKKTDLDLYKNNPALKNIGRNTGEAKKSLDDEEIFYSGHDPELDEINYGSEIEILEDDIDFNIIDDQIELEENLEYESDDEFDIIQSEEMEFEEYPHVEMKAPGPPVEIKRAEPTRAEQKQQIQDEQQNNPKPETKIIQQELEIDENDNKAIKNKPQTFDKLSKEKKEEIDRLFGFSEPESDNIKIFPKQEEEESYNEVLKNLFRIQSKREQLINNISKS